MKKRFVLLIAILAIGFLTACSNNKTDGSSVEDIEAELPTLEADLDLPASADVGEIVTFESSVTYDGELVKEADQVQYEVWQNGKKEDGELLDATNEGDGTYTLDYTFEQDATYTVQVHVDAEGLHTMPKAEIVIGEGSTSPNETINDFATEGFQLGFKHPTTAKLNEKVTLTTELAIDEVPLENVDVRYELLQMDTDKAEWVDAEEIKRGTYEATHSFSEKGSYTIVIHVEDDAELHEHAEYTIDIE